MISDVATISPISPESNKRGERKMMASVVL